MQMAVRLMHSGETDVCIRKKMESKLPREKELSGTQFTYLQIEVKRTVWL